MKKTVGVLAILALSFGISAQVKATISGEVFNSKEGDSVYISKFLGNSQVDLSNAMTLIKKKVN